LKKELQEQINVNELLQSKLKEIQLSVVNKDELITIISTKNNKLETELEMKNEEILKILKKNQRN